MKISAEININPSKHLSKVRDDAFWTYAANEWWKLITPYTPYMTGTTAESVEIRPKEIEYKQPDAGFLYNGKLMVDPLTGSSWARKDTKKVLTEKELDLSHNKHPLSSKEWDKVAEPLQKPKLIRTMQTFAEKR